MPVPFVDFYPESKSFLSPRSALKSYWQELGHTAAKKAGKLIIMIDLDSGTGLRLPEQNQSSLSKINTDMGI